MEIIPNIILGLVAIGTMYGFYKALNPFFTKKERYHDSVGASRTQSELIGRRRK